MEPLKNYFHYTRSERNGAIILIALCIGLALAPRLIPLFTRAEAIDFTEEFTLAESIPQPETGEEAGVARQLFPFNPNTATKEELMQLGLRERTANSIVNYRNKGGQFRKKEDLRKIYTLAEEDYLRLEPYIRIPGSSSGGFVFEKQSYNLFPFDPNTASEEELRSLGLPENVVRVMLRYREKGGKYRRKEDLQKIYILSEDNYRRIEPYITITSVGSIPTVSLEIPTAYEAPKNLTIDINKATEEEWQRLKGIGPAYAARIVKYRESLGGFSAVEQVAETRGLPDSTFQSIRFQLKASSILRPLSINQAGPDILAAHPYIDRRLAEAIVAYRSNHGNFRNIDDLRKVYALKPDILEKIVPYLSFE